MPLTQASCSCTYAARVCSLCSYTARVELGAKVLDDVAKLERTLAHELCHVAAWLVNHTAKPPHGPLFKVGVERAGSPGRSCRLAQLMQPQGCAHAPGQQMRFTPGLLRLGDCPQRCLTCPLTCAQAWADRAMYFYPHLDITTCHQ